MIEAPLKYEGIIDKYRSSPVVSQNCNLNEFSRKSIVLELKSTPIVG